MREPLWRSGQEAFFYLLPVGVLVMLYAVMIPTSGGTSGAGGHPLDLLITAGSVAMLIWRRRIPLVVGSVVAVMSGVSLVLMLVNPEVLGYPRSDPWLPLETPVAVYTIVLYRNNAVGWALIGGLTALACRPWDPNFDVITGGILMVVLPALLGLYIGAHRGLVHALTDRAERAEREQHLLAEQARTEERVRLAEEMHDVVTHRVSLMVLHAGALGLTAPDQPTREAAEDLRKAGCQALNELRDLVGVLRNGETIRPVPDRSDGSDPEAAMSALVAESKSVGIPVELVEDGNPERASPTVGRTAYRIVQESLTNIRKHAPGATARVNVHYGVDQVLLTVRNTPATGTVDTGLSASGSGTGLLGLRQRVELVGGTLHAGPSDDGGFEVDATLPAYVPTREKVQP